MIPGSVCLHKYEYDKLVADIKSYHDENKKLYKELAKLRITTVTDFLKDDRVGILMTKGRDFALIPTEYVFFTTCEQEDIIDKIVEIKMRERTDSIPSFIKKIYGI